MPGLSRVRPRPLTGRTSVTTTTVLALLSVVAASALFIALAIFLVLILRELEPTGGTTTSFLAKIRLGLCGPRSTLNGANSL